MGTEQNAISLFDLPYRREKMYFIDVKLFYLVEFFFFNFLTLDKTSFDFMLKPMKALTLLSELERSSPTIRLVEQDWEEWSVDHLV